MKGPLLFTLASGVGWFLGVMISVGVLFSSGLMNVYSFEEAMGNALALGFPGIILLMIAVILALKDTTGGGF